MSKNKKNHKKQIKRGLWCVKNLLFTFMDILDFTTIGKGPSFDQKPSLMTRVALKVCVAIFVASVAYLMGKSSFITYTSSCSEVELKNGETKIFEKNFRAK